MICDSLNNDSLVFLRPDGVLGIMILRQPFKLQLLSMVSWRQTGGRKVRCEMLSVLSCLPAYRHHIQVGRWSGATT
jgi:hypothetical protein